MKRNAPIGLDAPAMTERQLIDALLVLASAADNGRTFTARERYGVIYEAAQRLTKGMQK